MPSDNGIEQAVSDEEGIVRFNLSACLDSISLKLFTRLALVALDNFLLGFNLPATGAEFR